MKFINGNIIILLFLIFSNPILANKENNEFHIIDSIAFNAPDSIRSNVSTIVKYLSPYCKSETDKARIAFSYITSHYKYDSKFAKKKDKNGNKTIDKVLRSRKAICGGLSILYQAIVTEMGLEAHYIKGYSKEVKHRRKRKIKYANHAWNSVKVDGNWILVDVTFGQGYINEKGRNVAHFKPYWFNTPPNQFIITHYPLVDHFQYRDTIMDKRTFEILPYIDIQVFYNTENDVDNELNMFNEHKKFKVVKLFNHKDEFTLTKLPLHYYLKTDKNYEFKIECNLPDSIYQMVLITRYGYKQLFQKNNQYQISLSFPQGNRYVYLAYKSTERSKSYKIIAEYRIMNSKFRNPDGSEIVVN